MKRTKTAKLLSLLLSIVMMLGMMQLSVLAEDVLYAADFDSEETQAARAAHIPFSNSKENVEGYGAAFIGGLGGKAADDLAAVYTVPSTSAKDALQFLDFDTDGGYSKDIMTYEYSLLYSGWTSLKMYAKFNNSGTADYFTIENGVIYAGGIDTGVKVKANEWIRIVVEFHKNPFSGTKIYINGKLVEGSFTAFTDAYRYNWTQLEFSSKGDGEAYVAIDDVKTYHSAYVPTSNDVASWSIDESYAEKYDDATKTLLVEEGATVEDIASLIMADNIKVIESINNPAELEDFDIIEEGNVIVITSNSEKTFDYIYPILTLPEVPAFTGDVKFESDFNTADKQSFASTGFAFGDGKEMGITFEGGLGGKASDDYAMVGRFTEQADRLSRTFHFVPFYQGENLASGTVATMEFSALIQNVDYLKLGINMYYNRNGSAMGNYKDYVLAKNGVVTTVDGNSANEKYQKNEWIRVAIQLTYGSDIKVFLNGKLAYTNKAPWMRVGWAQLYAGYDSASANADRVATLALDDVRIYKGEYYNVGYETASIKISDDMPYEYDAAAETIYLNPNTTVEDVMKYISAEKKNTLEVHKSLSDPTVLTTGNFSDGNVIVAKSYDGKTFDYIHVSTFADGKILVDDKITSADPYYGAIAEAVKYKSKRLPVGGLFTKEADDKSFVIKMENLEENTAYESRIPFVYIPSSVFLADSFTIEFSLAASGDVNELSFVNRTNLSDGRAHYTKPLSMKNGKIYYNYNGTETEYGKGNKDQWYRIAVTYYIDELKYDFYLNNEKIVDRGWITNDPTARLPEDYDITGFEWFQIGSHYAAQSYLQNGFAAIDDVLVYYGEYIDKAENAIDFTTAFNTDARCDELYIDTASVEIDEFMDNSEGSEPMIFADKTYSSDVEAIENGNVIVLTSENGLVKKYYTVRTSEPVYGNEITSFVNGIAGNSFTAVNDVISVKANAYAPAYKGKKANLILAIYKDGQLVKVVSDIKDIKSDTEFEASYTLEETENVTATAMFIESYAALKPFAPAANFAAAVVE